ncbi:membrane protein YdbS with pleckstrin-like domain [Parabacteroides sp. PM5-20]|nr:membrane protein YdbS with pleckstrin-like domain [Parabacteroides sp. PM5-20]
MTVITVLILLIALATAVLYFMWTQEKPWMAFYVACCGGVLILNLLFSLFLVYKNFKKKK